MPRLRFSIPRQASPTRRRRPDDDGGNGGEVEDFRRFGRAQPFDAGDPFRALRIPDGLPFGEDKEHARRRLRHNSRRAPQFRRIGFGQHQQPLFGAFVRFERLHHAAIKLLKQIAQRRIAQGGSGKRARARAGVRIHERVFIRAQENGQGKEEHRQRGEHDGGSGGECAAVHARPPRPRMPVRATKLARQRA